MKPDIVAPGNRVISDMTFASYLSIAYPQNQVQVPYYSASKTAADTKWNCLLYLQMSGTSMAAPVVGQNTHATPDIIIGRMMKTAVKLFPVTSTAVYPVTKVSYTSQYDIFTIGAGRMDVGAALANADTGTGAVFSAAVSADPKTGTVSIVNYLSSL